jgi:hypothetical protein
MEISGEVAAHFYGCFQGERRPLKNGFGEIEMSRARLQMPSLIIDGASARGDNQVPGELRRRS